MKSIYLAFSVFALCSLPALPQSAASGTSDQNFVEFAAQTDMTEAHLGQMAAEQATGQNVKDFAQMLVTDHTNDYKQLATVAGKANIDVPKGLDAAHNKMIAPFEKSKGAAFDHRYAHEMVLGHEKAIAQYKQESEKGTNADLKAYATQALPTLEKHLQAAKELTSAKGAKK
ncbi:MAG: DUF4142 domain-containing protein [Bryobacteraceae bacterium]